MQKKKVLLHNPHAFDMIYTPLSYRMINKRAHLKYQHLSEILHDYDVELVIDFSESSFFSSEVFLKCPLIIRKLFLFLEVWFWSFFNDINLKINFGINKNKASFTLLSFSYKSSLYFSREKYKLYDCADKILCHLSHYMINTSEKSNNLEKFKDKIIFLADNDISYNSYFKKFFPWYNKKIYCVPFSVQKRFKLLKEIRASKNVLVSGTVHDLSNEVPNHYYSDFISHFKYDAYHMIRGHLRDGFTHPKIDNQVSQFRDEKNTGLQTKYFNIDLVDLLNKYYYVCYDSELSGPIALSNFEAMACGCIPIISPESIIGLSLEGYFDYISFDGSWDDLCNKVESLPDEFEISLKNLNISTHLINIAKKELQDALAI